MLVGRVKGAARNSCPPPNCPAHSCLHSHGCRPLTLFFDTRIIHTQQVPEPASTEWLQTRSTARPHAHGDQPTRFSPSHLSCAGGSSSSRSRLANCPSGSRGAPEPTAPETTGTVAANPAARAVATTQHSRRLAIGSTPRSHRSSFGKKPIRHPSFRSRVPHGTALDHAACYITHIAFQCRGQERALSLEPTPGCWVSTSKKPRGAGDGCSWATSNGFVVTGRAFLGMRARGFRGQELGRGGFSRA